MPAQDMFCAGFVPSMLRDLVVRGNWGTLAFPLPRGRGVPLIVKQLFQGLGVEPLPVAAAQGQAGEEEEEEDQQDSDSNDAPGVRLQQPPGLLAVDGLASFQASAGGIGTHLREWAPHILAAHPDARSDLESAVAWLDSCVTDMTPSGICVQRTAWNKHMFDTLFLLRCTLLSREIRCAGKMKSTIKQAVALVLPPQVAEHVAAAMDHDVIRLPSRSTLSRFHLVLDAAFMIIEREKDEEANRQEAIPPARYVMVDSSTQVGVDWMVTCLTEVAGEQLLEISEAVDRLSHIRAAAAAGGDTQTQPDEATVSALEHIIVSGLRIHALPPVAIGAGASSLSHKAHAVLHQSRLERESWQGVRRLAHTVFSFTTDLGVELGLHRLGAAVDLDQYVPGFGDIFMDTEGDVPPDLVSEPSDAPDLVSEPRDAPDLDDDMDLRLDDEPDLDDRAPQAPPPHPVHSEAPRFFKQSVAIPGLMHVLHNGVKDVTQSMLGFTWFFKPVKTFCQYMKKKPYRDRVIGMCFSKPPASWSASDIDGFAPDIADTRWGYLVTTLEELLAIESPLRAYWDGPEIDIPSLRTPSGHSADEDEGCPSDFVTSAAHWAYARMVLVAHGIVMKLESWAWGCPCHARLVDPGASWSRRSRVFRKQSPTSTFATCPMRGRRVAELAAGHVDSFLERHGAIAASVVILMTQGLQMADRDRILQDFE